MIDPKPGDIVYCTGSGNVWSIIDEIERDPGYFHAWMLDRGDRGIISQEEVGPCAQCRVMTEDHPDYDTVVARLAVHALLP